jgi:SAM-dependent methyltransferase
VTEQPAKTSWQQFFDEHAPHYMENVFVGATRAEVEFILELFELPAGSRVLDMGCGVGRHSIGLANHGWKMTGVDLSEGMLNEARKAAEKAQLDIEWIQADATKWYSDLLFDGALCLCEGGFGLAELNEDPVGHDLAMLRNIYASLRPNAPFLLTCMNGYALIRQMTDEHVQEGRFDPVSMLAAYTDEWNLPEGKRTMTIRERLFIPPEMIAMLRHVGFEVNGVWGGTAGEWGKRAIKLDEVEVMYFCHKR